MVSLSEGLGKRMVEDWINICGFLKDKASKKGKGSTLFEDRTSVQDKSGQRGSIY